MGLRGPAKKPSAVEIAEGRPGKRSINDHEPAFAGGEPDQPPGLSASARRVWRTVVPVLMQVPGLLSIADGSVLADYCEVRAEKDQVMRAARAATSRALRQAKTAHTAASPQEVRAAVVEKYGDTLNRLRHRENVLRRELGLSPSARSSLRIAGASGPAKTDPLDRAFFGNRPKLVAV